MFQLGPQNRSGYRPQAKEDRLRETGNRPSGLVGPALPQVFTLGPSVCKQTGRMRPKHQWPRSIISAPRRAPGNVVSMSGHVSMRGEKGQSLHKNQGLAGVKGHISCRECKEARGRIPVYQENEIKSLNCGQEKSHRV